MSKKANKFEELPDLLTMGHPLLAQPSDPVEPELLAQPAFLTALDYLHQAMVIHDGIGIAAPQVGWFQRIFLMVPSSKEEKPKKGEEPPPVCWINPVVVEASPQQGWAWEGCLSVPGMRGWIRRPLWVRAEGLSLTGEKVESRLEGWDARVFQHELDHLDGFLFPYRAADPRHIVTIDELSLRDEWPEDWPAPGAAKAPFGQVVPDQPF